MISKPGLSSMEKIVEKTEVLVSSGRVYQDNTHENYCKMLTQVCVTFSKSDRYIHIQNSVETEGNNRL